MLRLDDRWIWDFWTTEWQGVHHLFFLHAPRALGDPELRHRQARIGHAVSTDLVDWQLRADALAPSEGPAWDDLTTWTGSVIRHDGQWWMFYTGTCAAEDGTVQRVGAVVSADLDTWHRVHGPLIEADPTWYERLDLDAWYEEAWRDPWVLRDPVDGSFHAFVTARAASGPPDTRGVIGHAVSPDLLRWEVRPPVTEPGVFGHLEIPQLLDLGGRVHLLFSTPPAPPPVAARMPAAGVGGTHLLSADSLVGPFRWSTHKLLDGESTGRRYGGRVLRTDAGLRLLTWLANGPDGAFVGAIDDPRPVEVGPDGSLRVGLTSAD